MRDKRQWAIIPKKHRQILRLLRKGVGIKTTATIVGVGVRTVQRRKQLIEQQLNDPSTDEVLAVEFKRLVKPKACPVHGPVTVWPCVACQAIAMRQPKS